MTAKGKVKTDKRERTQSKGKVLKKSRKKKMCGSRVESRDDTQCGVAVAVGGPSAGEGFKRNGGP